MNEFLEWMKRNARAVALGAAGLLLLSVLIGLVIGFSARRAGLRVRSSAAPSGKGAAAPSTLPPAMPMKGGKTSDPLSDLPRSIVLDFETDLSSYSFSLDRAAAELESVEPLQIKISELIKYRDMDLEADVEPFVFDNEEFDVLIGSYEPSEP